MIERYLVFCDWALRLINPAPGNAGRDMPPIEASPIAKIYSLTQINYQLYLADNSPHKTQSCSY